MPRLPDFVRSYVDFIEFREFSQRVGYIDLTGKNWLNSTTVMLLAFLKNKHSLDVVASDESDAAGYLNWLTQDPMWWTKADSPLFNFLYSGLSYVPFSELPKSDIEFKTLLLRIYTLITSYETVGGQNAFKYVQNELSDNIYQHSRFERSFMMGQAYTKKKYLELSFVDDGVSIPGNFEIHGIEFEEDRRAIGLATEGVSTKNTDERGTGLGSSLAIYCIGADAEALIVSRNGLYYQKSDKVTLYSLNSSQSFSGTMVSIRVPMLKNEINISQYLE